MKKFLFAAGALALLLLAGCASTGLGSFGADLGSQSNPIPGSDPIRVPYTSTVKYFGYVMPGQPADATIDGKKVYYLYVWIPLVAPEIGIRMLSPVGDLVSPEEGDIVAANYEEGIAADPNAYFDTWISFERALTVLTPDQVPGAASDEWIRLATNDDSSEMPAQPSGSNYNSLLRVQAGDEPLVRGLYRIGFTTYKVGEVQGSFYAEVGAPIELPGVVVAKTLEDVYAGILASE